jgi:hypothetical protein
VRDELADHGTHPYALVNPEHFYREMPDSRGLNYDNLAFFA